MRSLWPRPHLLLGHLHLCTRVSGRSAGTAGCRAQGCHTSLHLAPGSRFAAPRPGSIRGPLSSCSKLSCGPETTDSPGPAMPMQQSGEGLGVCILRASQIILVHSEVWDHCPLATMILQNSTRPHGRDGRDG